MKNIVTLNSLVTSFYVLQIQNQHVQSTIAYFPNTAWHFEKPSVWD